MENFIKYLESKDLAKATQRAHIRRVNLFLAWYKLDVTNCKPKDILTYLEHLKNDKNQTNAYRGSALKSLEHYFEYLKTEASISNNPTAHIKLRGVNQKNLGYIFDNEQLEHIYDQFYKYYILNFDDNHISFNGRVHARLNRHRYYIMLGLLMFQGIATHELQTLELEDIDLNKAILHLKGTNKTQARKIPLKAFQIGAIMNYLNNIRPQFFEFCNESNKFFLPLNSINAKEKTSSENLLNNILYLNDLVKVIDKNFKKLKQFRTSMITFWLRTEGLRKAQYLAGHKYIRATEMYTTNDIKGLIDDIAKHHPVT